MALPFAALLCVGCQTTPTMAPDASEDGATPRPDGATGDAEPPVDDGSTAMDAAADAWMPPSTPDAGPPPMAEDCLAADVHCVDDDAGPTQEFDSIQPAIDSAEPGDTVAVFEGSYTGFRFDSGGLDDAPITVRAVGRVDLSGSAPGSDNVIRIQNVSHVTIDGFRIDCGGTVRPYDYDWAGIAARGALATEPMRSIVVRNMEITGCSPGGFYCSQCTGLVLSNNYIHDNVPHDGGDGMGVYLSNGGTDDVTVIDNRFEDNAGPGIHLNGDESIGGDGVQTGHHFERNTFIGNGQNGLNMDGVQSCTFINNVFADNRRSGIRGYRIDGAEGPSDFIVINNTFVGNGNNAVKLTADGGGNVLFNNLIVDNGEGDIDIRESTPQTSHNVIESGTSSFVDASSRDYALSATAAAVGAGVASFAGYDAPGDDITREPRSGAPDVGAHEAP